MLKKEKIIYGIHPLIEAIKSGKTIDKLLIRNNLHGEGVHELMMLVKEVGVPFQYVPVEKINKFTNANHQGVVGLLSEITYLPIEHIIPGLFEEGKVPLLLILDHITDVRNFGAIVRTAECAGVHAVIIPDKGSAQINADAVKASAGALNLVPVCRTEDLRETIIFLKDCGIQILGTSSNAGKEYTGVDMTLPSAIIMGAEDTGVSRDLLNRCDETIGIPLSGSIESMNVSVATGVVLFEVVRQRRAGK